MAKSIIMSKVGSLAFILGIFIALIFGIMQAASIEASIDDPTKAGDIFFATDNGGLVAWALAVIGAIIGVLAVMGRGTITAKEVPGFLIAGIGLLIMGSVFTGIQSMYQLTPWIGSLFSGISVSLSIFVAPAVGILAIKAIWDMGKD